MLTHFPGEIITFTAQRTAVLNKKRYKEGDKVSIRLTRVWHEDEGSGEGGPWGWGGYTGKFIKKLGEIIEEE